MSVVAVGTYEPAWGDGIRELGHDEDVTTLAVAAGRTALGVAADTPVSRVVVVSRLEDATPAVVALGLGLELDTPVELRSGGATDAVDALLGATAGTLVIGVDAGTPTGAAAALTGQGGARISDAGRVTHSLPMRVQRVGEPEPWVYDDARLERERGWRPAIERLTNGAGPLLVGLGALDAKRLGSSGPAVDVTGPAAPLFALALGGDRRVIALDSGNGAAVDVTGEPRVSRARRDPVPLAERPVTRHPADIPLALPAYDRAFVAKIALIASRCSCGKLSYPPREFCDACGRGDAQPEPLPRTGEVYTGVTIHVPVPGVPGPYGLVIAQLDGTDVRLLAHVTDAPASAVQIGARGELVLRRVAIRQGVNDYGYGWQPAAVKEVVA